VFYEGGNNPMVFFTSAAEQMRLTSTGLGIGTSSPAYKIDALGSTTSGSGIVTTLRLQNSGVLGSDGAKILFTAGTSTDGAGIGSGGVALNSADLRFFTGGNTERIRIDSSGNVGIGTSSPLATLDVRSTSPNVLINGKDTADPNIYFGRYQYAALSQSGAKIGYVYGSASGAQEYGSLTFSTATSAFGAITERARIDSSGRLLVGSTTSVISGDEIAGFVGSSGISAKATNSSANFAGAFWNTATSGDNNFLAFLTETGGTQRGGITYNRAAGLTSFNTTSDYRAKDINGPVTGSGALIDSVPVYMGKMKDATQERPMFLAHETPAYAHTGVKDAVDKDGKPVYQQMDASALIPVMWAEIQSLRQRLSAANL